MIRNCLSIDIKELDKGIENYIAHNATTPNYIVMNHETMMLIDNYYNTLFPLKKSSINLDENSKYAIYQGIPIAICDKLKVGEVDFV